MTVSTDSPFKSRYKLFGIPLKCLEIDTVRYFSLESDIYKYLNTLFTQQGWKFIRIETVNQDGFPDMLIVKDDRFVLIEAKRLNKKRLNVIEDDLTFEFGQLPFAVKAFKSGLNYALVVSKENKLAVISTEERLCQIKELF